MGASEVWLTVKERLSLKNDEHVEVIQTYIEEMEDRILHFCGISHVPKGLHRVWASMVMDAVRVELAYIDEIAKTVDRESTIKIGDTSSAPASLSGVTHMNKEVLDRVALNYQNDLITYRKPRW